MQTITLASPKLPSPLATILFAGLSLLLVSCSRTCGDAVYLVGPDIPAEKLNRMAVADLGVPREDLQTGHGPAAQAGRKMKIQLDIADSAGQSLGSGTLTFLYPYFDVRTWGPGVHTCSVSDEFFDYVMGMQVGGVRKFTIPGRPREYVEEKVTFSDCEADHTIADFSNKVTATYTVTLLSVCKPKFCSTSSPKIIDVGTEKLSREVSCD
jgi:hypothetical protein